MASIARDGLDFDKIYPIGSIYISVNSTNPHNLFGSTWEQLRDRFLLGCGTKENGTIGGEEFHTLNANEMPWHNHYYMASTSWGSGEGYPQITFPDWSWRCRPGQDFIQISSQQTHLGEGSTGAGGNQAHNNMPPYLAVYMWKRIS